MRCKKNKTVIFHLTCTTTFRTVRELLLVSLFTFLSAFSLLISEMVYGSDIYFVTMKFGVRTKNKCVKEKRETRPAEAKTMPATGQAKPALIKQVDCLIHSTTIRPHGHLNTSLQRCIWVLLRVGILMERWLSNSWKRKVVTKLKMDWELILWVTKSWVEI